MKWRRVNPVFREMETPLNELRGDVRTERGFVPGEVIGMGVGDERARFRVPWIEPKVEFRKVQAAVKTNVDQIGWRITPEG